MKRAMILGGGFGGIATAVALRERLDPGDEVVLVDRREAFVMGLRKNWALAGTSTIAAGRRPLAELAGRGVEVVRGTVTAIHPEDRAAEVDGRRLDADALVVALGAERDAGRVPGFAEHGHDAYDVDASDAARDAIDGLREGRLVIGILGAPYPCPPGPYELALVLADRFRAEGRAVRITVFTPLPMSLPVLGATGCATVESRLAEAGIDFRAGRQATAIEAGVIRFGDDALEFDVLLGVPPHRAPRVVADAGLAGPSGWIPVDARTLQTRAPGVWAIGDVTAIPLSNGQALPKAGVLAEAEGRVVAERIADAFAGRESAATFAGEGQCFLELGGGMATAVVGRFLADPPDVRLAEASAANLAAKEAFEADRLRSWFGR